MRTNNHTTVDFHYKKGLDFQKPEVREEITRRALKRISVPIFTKKMVNMLDVESIRLYLCFHLVGLLLL